MGEVSYVPVGTDWFRAQVIAEKCRAAGFDVELLTADEFGTFAMFGEIQPHQLLVRSEDVDDVRRVISDTSDNDQDRPDQEQ